MNALRETNYVQGINKPSSDWHPRCFREPAHDDEEGGKVKEKAETKPTSLWDNHVVKCEPPLRQPCLDASLLHAAVQPALSHARLVVRPRRMVWRETADPPLRVLQAAHVESDSSARYPAHSPGMVRLRHRCLSSQKLATCTVQAAGYRLR